jgi:RimJ/RimL family protein N-acetyltransferase
VPTCPRRSVWINTSDRFPSPYTRAAADAWVATANAADAPGAPITQLAIEVGGAACGGIGVFSRGDVQRRTKELGYWLGPSLWGRGIGGEAVDAFLPYLFAAFPDLVGRGQARVRGKLRGRRSEWLGRREGERASTVAALLPRAYLFVAAC